MYNIFRYYSVHRSVQVSEVEYIILHKLRVGKPTYGKHSTSVTSILKLHSIITQYLMRYYCKTRKLLATQ